MFGMAYIAVTAAIAWRCRSKAAYAALPALIGTVALFWFDVGHAGAYSSCLWVLSGAYLLINSEYVSGTLYGISGLIYIAFYMGASNATLSVIPIISDGAFILGLLAGTWPRVIIGFFRSCGRLFRGPNIQASQENLAGNLMPDRGEA